MYVDAHYAASTSVNAAGKILCHPLPFFLSVRIYLAMCINLLAGSSGDGLIVQWIKTSCIWFCSSLQTGKPLIRVNTV